jgi:HK97 family phage portal protein
VVDVEAPVMGFLARSLGVEKRFSLSESPAKDPALAALFGWHPVHAGVSVSEQTALNYSAVWRAVNLIAGTVGSLARHLYQRVAEDDRERADEHPAAQVVREPNAEMSAMVFFETLQAHVLVWGNAYAEIVRNGAGRPVMLIPLTPNRVTVVREGRRLIYRVYNGDGTTSDLKQMNVLHVPGLGFDGLVGYSVLRHARESIGLGLAAERFGATFFGNNAMPSIIFKHPGKLSTPAYERLKDSWQAMHGGPSNANKTGIAEEGLEIEKLTIPPEDAQFLETRKLQVVEVARWFGVAPHKLMDLERATFSNIEHQAIEYVQDTLRPWLVRWEQELNRKLLTERERERLYFEHLVDSLLRGDTPARYSAYAIGRQWGWLSADDVRQKENMNALPDGEGKLYLVPSNMTTPDLILNPPEPKARVVEGQVEDQKLLTEGSQRALIGAQRLVLVDILGRLSRKEAAAARRAAGRGTEAFRAWMDEFYQRHQTELVQAMLPAVRALLIARGSVADPGAVALEMAGAYIETSRRELDVLLAAKHPVSEFEDQVDRTVSRWEVVRPAEFTETVFTQRSDP